jgi:hypothetical protein
MSKRTRQRRPNPNAEIRIQLTPREFQDFQGASAIVQLKVQAIQQDAAQRIAAAQADQQKAFLRLVKKYRTQGLRPDVAFRFDEATHSLVLIESGRHGD